MARRVDERRRQRAGDRHEQRDDRSGDRHGELGARRARLAAQLRQPAEEPQVDALDLDPLAARDERVAELVDDDDREHARDEHDPGRRRRRSKAAHRVRQREPRE